MGRATIVENIGEGLYRIRLEYNLDPLRAELEKLKAEHEQYLTDIVDAIRTKNRLRIARDDARLGMDAVVDQWINAVITATIEEPPDIELADPESTVDEEQREALLTAINARRSTELTEVDELDDAILAILRYLAASGRTSDDQGTPENRASIAGYAFDSDVGVAVALQFGATSAEEAVERMMRNEAYVLALLSEDYTECGVAYLYAPSNRYGYLWGAILAAPGEEIEIEMPEDDEAKEAADEASAELERIEIPTIDTFQPKRLGEVCAAYGRAVAEYRAAMETVERILTDEEIRQQRMSRLQALIDEAQEPIHAWTCEYEPGFQDGDLVATAEVPGWYVRDETSKRAVVIDGQSVDYSERSINIVSGTGCDVGQINHADGIPPEKLGIEYLNAALEPGHLKWRPRWQYGVVLQLPQGEQPPHRAGVPNAYVEMVWSSDTVVTWPTNFEYRAEDAYAIIPAGVVTGGNVTPRDSADDAVDITACLVYLPAAGTNGRSSLAATNAQIERSAAKTCIQTSIFFSAISGDVFALDGAPGNRFSAEYDAEGGPVSAPIDTVRLADVRLYDSVSKPVLMSEIIGAWVIPAASGEPDRVDVMAFTDGALTCNGAADVLCGRSTEPTHSVYSLILSASGERLQGVRGESGNAFVETRGAAGGPPWIPVDAVELAQIRTKSAYPARIKSREISQTLNKSIERYDWPDYTIDPGSGTVTFTARPMKAHTGGKPKAVFGRVISTESYTVQLNEVDARTMSGLDDGLDLRHATTLTNVVPDMLCPSRVTVGDEVLIEYEDGDRRRPALIGWRREPKQCGRTWVQLR